MHDMECECILQALLGYGDGDVFGMSCLSVCGPASDKKVMRQIVTLQRTGQPGAAKVLCYKRDGTPFWSVACTLAVLCCAVLCCAVLCCAVLCCAVLCWAGLGWASLLWHQDQAHTHTLLCCRSHAQSALKVT